MSDIEAAGGDALRKVGEPVNDTEFAPERFIAGGETIARASDGKVTFIRDAVPGDVVMIAATESKADWTRGYVTEVIRGGPDRVDPPCPVRSAGCGGCDWQHVGVASQLGHKAEIVSDALRRTAKLPDAVLTIGESVPPVGYRTTIRVVGDDLGRPAFRAEHSHDRIAFGLCQVAHPRINELLADVCIDPGLELTMRVSAATGGATARWDTRAGTVTGLPAEVHAGKGAFIDETVAGHRFRVSAGSFFQSSPQGAELLVDAVRRSAPELADASNVVDAYSGVGLFAAAVAPPDAHVVAIESSKAATADAKINLAGRSMHHECAEVARWRPERSQHIDVVIADPSRTGLGKPGVGSLVQANAPVLILVSCDPVALARDTALLAPHGYRHVRTEVLDLFPMTHHVEAVTRFERTDVPSS